MTLTQSLDISQRSTQSARSATAPGEGDVYNWGVNCPSHAWPANVMVGREAATVERAELDASTRIHKRVDDILFEKCETFSKKREGVRTFVRKKAGGDGAVRISEKCKSFYKK